MNRTITPHPLWSFEYITDCPHCKQLTRFKLRWVPIIICESCSKEFYVDPNSPIEGSDLTLFDELLALKKCDEQIAPALSKHFKTKIMPLGKAPLEDDLK